ncbi:MAG: hypothetical protein COB12_12060 [Flavobacterium sp.]|nr:MAG: hypothetical protein COB12_12060 [Flavobacterium sp.]
MMNKVNANEYFPLYKYVYEEGVYGRDSGAEYSDPENDIRRCQHLTYFKKLNVDAEWVEVYKERCGEAIYAASKAVLTIDKLREVSEPSDDVCMFKYHDTVFVLTNYFPDQKAVCGTALDAHYWNEYEEDNSIKIGLMDSYVTFYTKNQLAIANGRIYFNGKLSLNREQIKQLGVRYDQIAQMYPRKVEDLMTGLYPEATEYSSNMAWGKLNIDKQQ